MLMILTLFLKHKAHGSQEGDKHEILRQANVLSYETSICSGAHTFPIMKINVKKTECSFLIGMRSRHALFSSERGYGAL